jgi:hypothetical protein
MPVRFVCPQCGASGRLPEGFAGDRIKCPRCKAVSPLATGSLPAAPAPAVPVASVGPPVYEVEATREAAEGPAYVPSLSPAGETGRGGGAAPGNGRPSRRGGR